MQRALLITNLKARSVSLRVKSVIEKALSADIHLELADTAFRNHATELAADAASRGFDLVIAFGGDGTMNEVANGIAQTDTALAVLPGGTTNVLCRHLGMPVDIVEATGLLMRKIKTGNVRRINIGRMDDRYFVMGCGAGLDAATVRRTEADPAAKRRYRHWFFLYCALAEAFTGYRGKEPYIKLSTQGHSEEVLLAVFSNIPEFTYFNNLPLYVAPKASIEAGLDVFAMRRFPMHYIPALAWSIFRSGTHIHYKHASYIHDRTNYSLSSNGPAFPIQVDGEYIGDRTEVVIEQVKDGLAILV